ncbi:uncharacterized protein LOC119833622 [Zerene cesonia]|uniref:uncharacterized protein LOC119833622 n=1 Tax=Zerene cesonia TaxID=33412 RepID=UPI0018E58DCE|nr:uncharacterized protein LOC119833622 [Zerene cesonia]
MQEIQGNKLLQLHSDTVETVRRSINLEKDNDRRHAIDILKKWVEMQPHFLKKDFPDTYLESCIITSKGSIENAKKRLDKMCTIKTLMPEFFEEINPKSDFDVMFDVVNVAICPKLTREHHRLFMAKGLKTPTEPQHITLVYKFCILISEYARRHDYVDGFRVVYELSALDLVKFVSNINVVELRQALSIYMDGYGMKLKGIHLITQSKAIDLLVQIFKQILKPKLASRIHIHKSCDELHDLIGKEVLPVEFGGYEKSIKELQDEWINVLASKENMDYMREMRGAKTNESLRQSDRFNAEYAGMPGTFRVLSVD